MEVRYEIEMRRGYDGTGVNPHPWKLAWTAKAAVFPDEDTAEVYARTTFDGFAAAGETALEWQLVRRVRLATAEILAGTEQTNG